MPATAANPEFEQLVGDHYQGLYRFALSLSHRIAEAEDLVQQTFMRWAEKGHQLRERAKAKTWLYTTLYREFLGGQRRATRFPHQNLEDSEHELPGIDPEAANKLDGQTVMAALDELDENYRAPLALFYLQDHSYKEIAEILEVPIGTVMSRLSRGKDQLKKVLAAKLGDEPADNIIPFQSPMPKAINE